MNERIVYTKDYGDSDYFTVETTIVEHNNLIDAMKAQAAKNKEICDEIIRKADMLDEELNRYDKK